jgi:Lon protease-like protein
MPRAILPITMSESDYLGVASEILENNLIAVIQPRPVFVNGARNLELIEPFKTGCAGRISDVNVVDGEVSIIIQGICRFETISEIPTDGADMKRISVSYDKYMIDIEETDELQEMDKYRLMSALNTYFKTIEVSPNWKEIERAPADVLISALAMACPFHPSEKQSLLEVVGIKERSDMITKIIEMNSFDRYDTARTVN